MIAAPIFDIALAELIDDPYPIYEDMRRVGPLCWVPQLRMYYVTQYCHVHSILRDTERFKTGTSGSLILDTFGEHVMTVDGAAHERLRGALRGLFAPAAIHASIEQLLPDIIDELITSFRASGSADLRRSFAARLPILVMLELFGLDRDLEGDLRRWYDGFERALSNFTRDATIRQRAIADVQSFHRVIHDRILRSRIQPSATLIDAILEDGTAKLTDDEVCRNASIIFFGGISTVEGLILNTLGVLLMDREKRGIFAAHPDARADIVDETMRWMSPVQSATRHVAFDCTFEGVGLRAGDTVNCMLGAANRDPAVFPVPDRFDLNRTNKARHLGFASGPHFCLGSHLAKLEARTAITKLLERCPDISLAPASSVRFEGYEFRQPRRLDAVWTSSLPPQMSFGTGQPTQRND